jgi:hypothetical protein
MYDDDDFECCASGSCEVCRRPQGYSREQRAHAERVMDTYEPPWVRQRKREDAERGNRG